jgi:hypothetical protein
VRDYSFCLLKEFGFYTKSAAYHLAELLTWNVHKKCVGGTFSGHSNFFGRRHRAGRENKTKKC